MQVDLILSGLALQQEYAGFYISASNHWRMRYYISVQHA